MHLISPTYIFLTEEKRFEKHYMPMTRELFALAYRLLQDEEEARDMVQDVLGKLWQMRSDLPPDGADLTYCKAMIRNKCLDSLRQKQVIDFRHVDNEEQAELHIPTDSDFYARLEAQDYLYQLLNELPPRARQIIELRLRDGFSFKEIEQLTGISEGNARVILLRTLKSLRNEQQPD